VPAKPESDLGYVYVDWKRGEAATFLVTDGFTIRQIRASELRMPVARTLLEGEEDADEERGFVPWWLLTRAQENAAFTCQKRSCTCVLTHDVTYDTLALTMRSAALTKAPSTSALVPSSPPRHAIEVSAKELRRAIGQASKQSATALPPGTDAFLQKRRATTPFVCLDVAKGDGKLVLSIGAEPDVANAKTGALTPLASSVFLGEKEAPTSGERTRVWVRASYLRSCVATNDPRVRLDLRGALDIVIVRPTIDRLAGEPSREKDFSALMPVRA
jgi:hypothetical protein